MKKNKYIKWLMPVACAFVLASCIDEDMNTNPGTSPDLDPNMQVTTVQVLPSNDAEAWHRYLIYPSGFMNQWTNDWAITTYGGTGKKSDSYFSQLWTSTYPSVITNVVDLVERTKGVDAYTNINAAGRVMKVENFLKLTDYYGDIPYFNAGKAYYSGVFKPEYDKQEDIYNDFLKELKEAVAQFDASKPSLTADLYFGGDINKWKRFANSLRFRIAMRLIKVDPAKAQSEAVDAAKAGLMTSNADICFVLHDNIATTDPSAGNGLANRFLNDKSSTFRISKELMSTMEKTNDPRIRYYASSYLEDGDRITRTDISDQLLAHYGSYAKFCVPAQRFNHEPESQIGMVNDLEITTSKGQTVKVPYLLQFMQPSNLISNPSAPFIHMSYAEVEFLLADAALRGYNVGGTAATHYKAGLEAAVRQWTLFGATINETALTKFITDNTLSSNNQTALEQVNTQLWILHFMDPFETWSNWRRTGMPAEQTKFHNYRPAENQSNAETPRRVEYPVSEQTSNPEGYKTAVERFDDKKDSWLHRVWWDKK